MTEMEKLVVMWAVGLILTVTITGSVILDAKMRHKDRVEFNKGRYVEQMLRPSIHWEE